MENLYGESGWRAWMESQDVEPEWRRSGMESWDREHVWTIWISKGFKIGLKHNKQKGNMNSISIYL